MSGFPEYAFFAFGSLISWAGDPFAIILQFDKLKNEGCSSVNACEVLQYSRSTISRWKRAYQEKGLRGLNPISKRPHTLRKPQWSKKLELLVYDLRKKNPCWGKLKIHRLIVRDYNMPEATVATVGRIISKLIKLNRVPEVATITGRKQRKKRRQFTKHASRWAGCHSSPRSRSTFRSGSVTLRSAVTTRWCSFDLSLPITSSLT